MPKKTTVEIICIGCNKTERYELPQGAIYPAPPVLPLQEWVSIASTSAHMMESDYLCPQCASKLPTAALEALRREQHECRAHRIHTYPFPMHAETAKPFEDKTQNASNVHARKLLDAIKTALDESGYDIDRAARTLVERFDATPADEKLEFLDASVRAVVRAIEDSPQEAKAHLLSFGLALQHLTPPANPGANGVIPFQHAADGANGVARE